MYVSFAAQYVYLNRGLIDCLVNNDIHSLESDETSNNCMDWCNDNENCSAFALYQNTCYFKDYSCVDIKNAVSTILFVKQDSRYIF